MPSDAELIEAVRGGEIEAYGQLYERHVRAAFNLALQLSGSTADADDLVSDAFAKVLRVLRAGSGPSAAFRPYLLTAVRNTAYDKTRKDRRVELAGDVEEIPGAAKVTSVPFQDTAVAGLDQTLAATAFASLPEHWQTVLWHTAIEGQSPGEIAPILGLTANGVSAMAHRAREGLRQAYLQAHVAVEPSERCRATVSRLGAWARGGVTGRAAMQLDAHLDRCGDCRALAAELADVNGALRGVVAPLVLGTGAAGYMALGAGKASAAVSLSSSAVPWLGVAASTAAVVVAVSGSSPVEPPPAPAIAVPISSSARPATPAPGATSTSTPVSTGSAPTSSTTGGATNTPGPGTSTTGAATSTELVANAPGTFQMTHEGPPAEMPIVIENTGSEPAAVPTLTLVLPDRYKTVGPGNTPAGAIGCPAGKGTVTCRGGQTLAPGESVTFIARLQAGPKAENATITGSAGSLRISVAVTIAPKK